MSENYGARGESVDKQGQWATKSRNGAYANHVVPWDCVRVLAGFCPESNRYHITRDLLKPPKSLREAVFPLLETSRYQLLQAKSHRSEIAGSNFFELLDYMRDVVLQDAAILTEREDFKSHVMFAHPLFKTNDFIDFKKSLLELILQSPSPESTRLHEAVPLVAESLEGIRKDSANILQHLSDMK
ncbi:hypothetical protein AeMF1_009075, partial [Aphanomyces euteiches]